MTELERISAVRTAATWMRTTSKTMDQYPKRDKLDGPMRQQAEQFACGMLPWPSRWTVRLYQLAIAG